jgi:transcriptional regulator with XRE-family HTH domain
MKDQPPGSSNMASIDGEKVRKLRENKGLTQLYVATFVGVTTDTISRWENRRYPNIKQENAEKLAAALEVELAEIVQDEEMPPAGAPAISTADVSGPSPARHRPVWFGLLALLLVILVPAGVWWFYAGQKEEIAVAATRLLPPHIPAGEVFPVIIHVKRQGGESFPLIVKEIIPLGCAPVRSAPPFTHRDEKQRELKWISRTGGAKTTIAYLVRAPAKITAGNLVFSGTVTLRNAGSLTAAISGTSGIAIANFHWADANRDGKISDEEILTVYDKYAALDQLGYKWGEIDDIWSGTGYRWDAADRKYVIIP